MVKESSVRFREIIKVFASYGFGYIFDSKTMENKKSPKNLRKAFEELGPTFIKIGQILSTRPDLIPREYLEELTKLQDSVPEENFESMKLVLENSLHTPMEKVLKSINTKPIASASIAQVYEGILNDGRSVVIKIQRPDIYKKIQLDIFILFRLFRLTRMKTLLIDPIEALREIEAVTKEELDFISEAENIKMFRKYNINTSFVYAPYVAEGLVSDKVLIMEKIDGFKINSTKDLFDKGYDNRDIAKKLALSYCKQIFKDGFFHGDPHPGNILISGTKLCFIDFGIVGKLSDNMKKWLNSVMFAIATKDKDKLTDCILSIGIKKGKSNRIHLYDSVSYMFDTYLSTSIKNIKVSVLMQEIYDITRQNNIQIPRDLVCLIRGLVILEGVVAEIDPELEIISIIISYTKSGNKVAFLETLDKEELMITLYSFARDGIKIPTKTLELLNKLSAGEGKLELKVNDMDNVLMQINKMVNRITSGVMISALMLSSSLIISNNIEPTYKGMSVIGLAGYTIGSFWAVGLFISMIKAGEFKGKGNKK